MKSVAAACTAESRERMACAMDTVAQVGADWYQCSVPRRRSRCFVADAALISVLRNAFHSCCVSLQPPLLRILVSIDINVGSVNRFIVLSR